LAEGLEPHKVRELWVTDQEDQDLFVDVSEHMDTAVKAILQHKSQIGDGDVGKYLREGRQRGGAKVGLEYAETFKQFRL
jgi:LmbE family N-acetylglucosaminyl deacetylase